MWALQQQVMASSVGTHRRIVQWQVREAEGGGFSAVPRVVVERISTAPRRITSVLSGRASVSAVKAQTGLPTSGLEQVPVDHWYAIGRDKALEISLAEDLRDRMQKHPSGATLQRTHATGGK